MIVDYENGVRAHLDLCMFAEGGRNEQELTAVGSRAKVETAIPGDGRVYLGRRFEPGVVEIDAPMDESVAHTGFHHGASFVEVARFCDAIRNGSPAEVTPFDGLWSVVIGAAAHRSIEEGRPIPTSELLEER